jgi:hypothetical protein
MTAERPAEQWTQLWESPVFPPDNRGESLLTLEEVLITKFGVSVPLAEELLEQLEQRLPNTHCVIGIAALHNEATGRLYFRDSPNGSD